MLHYGLAWGKKPVDIQIDISGSFQDATIDPC